MLIHTKENAYMYGLGAAASSRKDGQKQRQKVGEWLNGLCFVFSEQFDSATMGKHVLVVSTIHV